jgi:hypothetical protein
MKTCEIPGRTDSCPWRSVCAVPPGCTALAAIVSRSGADYGSGRQRPAGCWIDQRWVCDEDLRRFQVKRSEAHGDPYVPGAWYLAVGLRRPVLGGRYLEGMLQLPARCGKVPRYLCDIDCSDFSPRLDLLRLSGTCMVPPWRPQRACGRGCS